MTHASRNNGSLPKALVARFGTGKVRELCGLPQNPPAYADYLRAWRKRQ